MNSLPSFLKKTRYLTLGSIAFVAMLTGCATTLDHAPFVTEVKNGELTVITGSAETSDTIISNASTTSVICKTPSAFAIRTASQGSDIKLVAIGGSDDSESETESEGGTEMRGRTASLLITQEVMYRFCELSRNAKLTKVEQIDLFKTILGTLETPWLNLSGEEHKSEVKTITSTDSAPPTTATPPTPPTPPPAGQEDAPKN